MTHFFPIPSFSTGTIIILIIIVGAVIFFTGYVIGGEQIGDTYRRKKKISRSILGGMFSEQVAPFLPSFPKELKASEARFIGKPIDFLIFKGMDEQNITEVVFVEIKSGNSQLSVNERKLRDAIKEKRVSWYEYRVDEEVSKLQDTEV